MSTFAWVRGGVVADVGSFPRIREERAMGMEDFTGSGRIVFPPRAEEKGGATQQLNETR